MFHIVLNRLSLVLFVAAIVLAIFGYGVLVGEYHIFPYWVLRDGIKTGRSLFNADLEYYDGRFNRFLRFSDVLPENIESNRIEFVAGKEFAAPILWFGDHFQFNEYCPGFGCLAVEYTRRGAVAHAYPLRLAELEEAAGPVGDRTFDAGEFPYEFIPGFSFIKDTHVSGISRYANGDLLVIFHYRGGIRSGSAFPFGAGVARIDRDGHPLWYRRDYSHHWPYLLDDGTALVPSLQIDSEPVSFQVGDRKVRLGDCDSPYRDTVHIIDRDGRLLKHIDLLDALLVSPYVAVLQHSSSADSCDPLHLNFIHQLGEDAGGAWGIGPGDLVVSLRNLSAFAILDWESGRVKRVVRGNFLQQHSVRHLEGSTFVMFDNQGHDEVGGPSRLLLVDLADGRETTIFPNGRIPESWRDLFFSNKGSYIDISADRKRVLILFTHTGVGVEVRLSDGEIMTIFRSLHDVSDVEQFPDERKTRAAVFRTYGLSYIHDAEGETAE